MSRYRRMQIGLFCLSILGLFLLGACGRNEARTNEGDQQDVPSLQIPLEEIVERIEYEYVYENMIDHIADYDYSLEGDYCHRIRECIVRDKDAVYEEIDLWDSPIYFSYEFVSDDLIKLEEARDQWGSVWPE